MSRAEKNIKELLEDMQAQFHQLRQSGINEERFDLVSGATSACRTGTMNPATREKTRREQE